MRGKKQYIMKSLTIQSEELKHYFSNIFQEDIFSSYEWILKTT